MDGGAAVHRDVGHGLAPHQMNEERAQPDLDHVPAQHRHDRAPSGRRDHLLHDVAQVLGREDRGEPIPERGERAVGAGGVGEEGGIDFVVALGDGDGLETGEVGFAVVRHGCSGTESSLSFNVT